MGCCNENKIELRKYLAYKAEMVNLLELLHRKFHQFSLDNLRYLLD